MNTENIALHLAQDFFLSVGNEADKRGIGIIKKVNTDIPRFDFIKGKDTVSVTFDKIESATITYLESPVLENVDENIHDEKYELCAMENEIYWLQWHKTEYSSSQIVDKILEWLK